MNNDLTPTTMGGFINPRRKTWANRIPTAWPSGPVSDHLGKPSQPEDWTRALEAADRIEIDLCIARIPVLRPEEA